MTNCQSFKGYTNVYYQMSPLKACPHAFSGGLNRHIFNCVPSPHNQLLVGSGSTICKFSNHLSLSRNRFRGHWMPMSTPPKLFHRRVFFHGWSRKQAHPGRFRIYAALDVATAVEVINDLGFDTLTFLAVTVMVVPAFKIIRASPILGFFIAGVILNQFGLIRNLTDVKVLSEWGILFLLFEMGLELSLARLKALAKFAFGMGLTQVVLSTLAFTAFELPPNGAIGTKILEFLFHSRPDLVNIRSIDEAIVIGAALSLSSSAFVLQRKASSQQDLVQQLWEFFSYRT